MTLKPLIIVMNDKGFKIPENYFEERKASLKQIALEQGKEKSPRHRLQTWTWLSAAAAVIAIALFLLPFEKDTSPELHFSELEADNLMDFLSEDPYAVYPESFIQMEDSLDSHWELIDADDLENYLDTHTYEYL